MQPTYEYDDFGQLRRQTSPVTGTTTYSYDGASNLTGTTDANGNVTTRSYDAANRVLATTATNAAGSESVTNAYDDLTGCRAPPTRPAARPTRTNAAACFVASNAR